MTPAAQTVQELVRQVRGDTLRILDATPEACLCWAPAGTSNHVLWHAGHALWLQDLMCVEPLSGTSALPAAWAEKFGMNSRPSAVATWPDAREVGNLLRTQQTRMLQLLEATTDEVLWSVPPTLGGNRNQLGWIVHGLHDEAKHSGEMYLLWKLHQARSSTLR